MKNNIFNKASFRLLFPVFAGITGYLLILLFNNNVGQLLSLFESQELYLFLIISFVTFELARLSNYISKKLFRFFNKTLYQLLTQLLLGTITTYAIAAIAVNLYFNYFVGYSAENTLVYTIGSIFILLNLMFQTMSISAEYIGMENDDQIKKEMALHHSLNNELNQFKDEINPELFQSALERCMVLCYEDPEMAETMIDALSLAYRYSVSNKQENKVIAFHEELDAAKNLGQLMEMVWHCKVELTYDGQADNQHLVPGTIPSILQSIFSESIIDPGKHYTLHLATLSNKLEISWNIRRKINCNLAIGALYKLNENIGHYIQHPIVETETEHLRTIVIPLVN